MSQGIPTSAFNYSLLNAETSWFVQQQTGEIKAIMKRTAQDIFEIGQKLIKVKQKLGHGRFLEWLETEFDWSWDTAKRFMRVAEVFGKNQQIAEFDVAPSALYLLAAPSTPEAARSEALARASAGELITHKVAQKIKQKYSLPPAQPHTAPETRKAAVTSPISSIFLNTEQSHQLEVLAVIPPEVRRRNLDSLVIPTHNPLFSSATAPLLAKPKFVQPESWWKLGERHLLYCGDPNSARFKSCLPQKIALTVAFPSSQDWRLDLPTCANSTLTFFTRYRDLDLTLLREMIKDSLLLCTEGEEAVVFSFFPDPELLLLANQLDCRCFIAEPDQSRCWATITTWEKSGAKRAKTE